MKRLEIRVRPAEDDQVQVVLGRGAKEVLLDTALLEDAEGFIEQLAVLLGMGASCDAIYTPAPVIMQLEGER